jgi:hypothetical protein
MACNDHTPWTITNHPFTVNRLRVTAGGNTNQTTGAWTPESTSSVAICGALKQTSPEHLRSIEGGQFKEAVKQLISHTDCDILLNDIIEVYEDVAGSSKTYWRVIEKIKTLTTASTLRGYGMTYWKIQMEQR